MPSLYRNTEYLNLNSQRAYPFTESASRTDITETFTIPNDFLLELRLPVHAGLDVDPGNFFLRELHIAGPGYSLAIAYNDGSDDPPIVARAAIARATHEEYDSYEIPGLGDFEDTRGRIVLGRLAAIDALPAGSYQFEYAAGQLEVICIEPMIRAVQSLYVRNGSELSRRLYGDVEMLAGNNIQFTVDYVDGRYRVRVDAISGVGLNEDCECADETAPPIRTINGVGPDSSGNLSFVAGTCVDIVAITNGLKFIDTCSAPCCDCEELAALTSELELLGPAATTVTGFVTRLEANVEQMSQVVLGSRLLDRGCFECGE